MVTEYLVTQIVVFYVY